MQPFLTSELPCNLQHQYSSKFAEINHSPNIFIQCKDTKNIKKQNFSARKSAFYLIFIVNYTHYYIIYKSFLKLQKIFSGIFF